MRLIEFIVEGLNGRSGRHQIIFNDDITVLIGKNGSGKTTLLKLMWFLISGNLERVSREIDFKYAKLKTNRYEIEYTYIDDGTGIIGNNLEDRLVRRAVQKNRRFKIKFSTEKYGDGVEFDSESSKIEIDDLNTVVATSGSSIYFPTFRRFEGGYTINHMRSDVPGRPNLASRRNKFDALALEISEELSVMNHKFIISFSATDISSLISQRYAQASQHYQESQKSIGGEVIDEIRKFRYNQALRDQDDANNLIASIESKIHRMEEERGGLMMPIFSLEDYINRIIGKEINILPAHRSKGQDNSMTLDQLSAGEKQMISFMCYNALNNETPVFIDEPELSLNGDWQRRLFSVLLNQNPTNQYIISTHSPFIYANLKDKVYIVNTDGDLGE